MHATAVFLKNSTPQVRIINSGDEGWWIFFVRDTCGAGTGCMFQK
jgi:hypothetical protein